MNQAVCVSREGMSRKRQESCESYTSTSCVRERSHCEAGSVFGVPRDKSHLREGVHVTRTILNNNIIHTCSSHN